MAMMKKFIVQRRGLPADKRWSMLAHDYAGLIADFCRELKLHMGDEGLEIASKIMCEHGRNTANAMRKELGLSGNTLEEISEVAKVVAQTLGIEMEYSVHLKEARWIKKKCRMADVWKEHEYPPWMCDLFCGEKYSLVTCFIRTLNSKAHYQMTKSIHKFGDTFCEKILTIDRVSTGNAIIDALLYGGIPESYAVLLMSPPCDERNRFLEAFTRYSVLDGHSTCYITSEPRGILEFSMSYPKLMRLILCHPRSDQTRPTGQNIYRLEGVDSLINFNILLMQVIQSMEYGERKGIICIDNLSDILSHHGANTTKKWLSDILQRLKDQMFTILIVLNPDIHPKADVEALRELFDGEFEIRQERLQEGIKTFFRVIRMYQQIFLKKEIILE